MRQVLRRLNKLYDPLALCYGLGQKTDYGRSFECDHSFAVTTEVLREYAPSVNAEQYLGILQEAGAHCDCEVMHNICPETGA